MKLAGSSPSLEESKHLAKNLVHKLPNAMFVCDRYGNVLLSNSSTPLSMGLSLGEFLHLNVKDCVNKGYYDVSVALEAAATQHQVSRVLTTRLGVVFVSTSTPILDEQGSVSLTVTNAIPIEEYERVTTKRPEYVSNQERRELDYMLGHVLGDEKIIAESQSLKEILLMANALAQTESTVMITGETGCGKEVIAKYIHSHSRRAYRPFVAVNVATLPENLIEAELFGYERGAFTGAKAEGQAGLFADADGGTLFLDEIGELPLQMQSKLLRVIETGEVRRVGGRKTQRLDVRLITATHRNLEQMVHDHTFREDLYYRINVIPVHIPPLRQRPEDIRAMASKFLEDLNEKYESDVQIDSETMRYLLHHNWPGNVRELRNYMERHVFHSKWKTSMPQLQTLLAVPAPSCGGDLLQTIEFGAPLRDILNQVEERYVKQMLTACDGKIGVTANKLGIYRTALHRKLKAYRERDNSPK